MEGDHKKLYKIKKIKYKYAPTEIAENGVTGSWHMWANS